MAVGPLLETIVPSPHLPWLPPPSATRRLARVAALAAAVPVVAAALAVDLVKDALPTDENRPGNAYRVVARAPGRVPD
jgi:hypothetical protein